MEEIVSVVLEIEDIKKCRAESLRLNSWEKFNFVMDSAGKTLRKMVRTNKDKGPKPNTVQARSA